MSSLLVHHCGSGPASERQSLGYCLTYTGIDDAWTDRQECDIGVFFLCRKCPRERVQTGLGEGIHPPRLVSRLTSSRGHEDDARGGRWCRGFPEVRERRLEDVHRAEEVGLEGGDECVEAHVGEFASSQQD